jgi:glycine/D-amino acid oxidase-like deaminating enzyme
LATGISTNKILASAGLPEFPLFESPGVTFEAAAPEGITAAITAGRRGIRVWESTMKFGSYDFGDEKFDRSALKKLDANGFVSQVVNSVPTSSLKAGEIATIRGVRSFTKDRLPIVGSYVPFQGFPELRIWVATAFYKIGFYLADYCAQNLILALKNAPADPFFEEMSPQRLTGTSKCMI